MIVVDPVLESHDALYVTSWPTTEPPNGLLALNGQMSQAEVGTAIAVIFKYAAIPTDPVTELHTRMAAHLASAKELVAPGGLRFRDTETGAEIIPGCCTGLESWQDWQTLLTHQEETIYGHNPAIRIHQTNNTLKLTQDPIYPQTHPQHLELPTTALQPLLTKAHHDLQAFLTQTHHWATHQAPAAAPYLVQTLATHFKIHPPPP